MDQKRRLITISGRPGSGKSSTAKTVAKALGYEHFSSGDLFREMAKERGIDVLEINLAAEKEKEIDYLVDQRLRDIGATEDDYVVDSRMAWHWMPNSFKVFLDLDLKTAAERILSQMTPERIEVEHIPTDPGEYANQLKERLASESRRYDDLYKVNPYKLVNYDLVIDTKKYNLDQVVEKVLKNYKNWLSS